MLVVNPNNSASRESATDDAATRDALEVRMSLSHSTIDVDQAAEREARAIEWLVENELIPAPGDPDRENRVVRRWRYPLAASLRAHERIAKATFKGLFELERTFAKRELTRPSDRQRRRERRARRVELLKVLDALPVEAVSLDEAARLVDASRNTLMHLITRGVLGRVYVVRDGYRRRQVPVADLRRYLASKCGA
jgi:hypothetical protein